VGEGARLNLTEVKTSVAPSDFCNNRNVILLQPGLGQGGVQPGQAGQYPGGVW
jgi:hypothetical protein